MPTAQPVPDRAPGPTSEGAQGLTRRDALKLAAAGLLPVLPRQKPARRVVIIGAGIAGLSCAWELRRRGHDVVLLEASGRTGGHVFTVREGLDDGLYADGGAEHFTQPGYERYWEYVREFNLAHVYYPRREHLIRWIDGRPYTPEMLADRAVLAKFGLNAREVRYLADHPFPELAGLFYAPYVDDFEDEYKPFDAGLDRLDAITETELMRADGASAAALRLVGGGGSALQAVWHAAILKMRGVPLFPPRVHRLVGGNQTLTDTFAAKLGDRVRLHSPVTRIEHGQSGVRVTVGDAATGTRVEGDALVCALSARMLATIPVSPAWPAARADAINNVPYYHDTRVIFQSRSRFWQRDAISPNLEIGEASLQHVWAASEEVDTPRGLLAGAASGPGTPEAALATFRKYYQGRSEDIEKTRVVVWALDPWASACERTAYPPGQLRRFWPILIEPHGRIHFAGAYADNLNWGMEAATRSAHRVATAIDAA